MRHGVVLLIIEVSEEHIASIIGVRGIGEQGTTLAVASNRSTLLRNNNVVIKIAVFSDVTMCDFCKNPRFWGMYRLHYHGDNNRRAGNNVSISSAVCLLVTVNVVPRWPILVTFMMKAIIFSETSVLTKPHRVTSQKTVFYMVTVMNTSNFKTSYFFAWCFRRIPEDGISHWITMLLISATVYPW
jgi:hypothetical protein